MVQEERTTTPSNVAKKVALGNLFRNSHEQSLSKLRVKLRPSWDDIMKKMIDIKKTVTNGQ